MSRSSARSDDERQQNAIEQVVSAEEDENGEHDHKHDRNDTRVPAYWN
jgi:hypothetical protein